MSTPVIFNGVSYTIPAIADSSWGTNVSNYLIAIASGALQKTGGAFTLSAADVDFGGTYGLKALYFKTKTANLSATGVLRLARVDVIGWRNEANLADLPLGVNASDQLTFNGVPVGASTDIVPPQYGGTGIANNAASTLTITGAFPIAVTVSGATAIVMPTTGTLATLGGVETLTSKTLTAPDISSGSFINLLGQAAIRFNDDTGGQYVALRASIGTTTYTINLPTAQGGASTTLSNDGSGNLSWVAGVSAAENQYNIDIGDSTNTRTPTNTNLLGDIIGQTRVQTTTVTIAVPGVFTSNSHGMTIGNKFYLTTTGALPTGLSASTTYYASNIAANTFNASSTYANAIAGVYITTTGSQSGIHTLFMGGLTLISGVRGTPTNTTPLAGYVGERLATTLVTSGSPTALTNAQYLDLASLPLTPGVWDVTFNAGFGIPVSATVTSILAGISTTSGNSATGLTLGSTLVSSSAVPTGNSDSTLTIMPQRILLSGAITYYLKVRCNFSAGGVSAYGMMQATRVI